MQEGLTEGGVLFWVGVQERRVGCEGANSKSLLRCELPAQGPTNHVVNRKVKHLHTHTHTSYFSLESEPSKLGLRELAVLVSDMNFSTRPVKRYCHQLPSHVFSASHRCFGDGGSPPAVFGLRAVPAHR